MVSSNIPAILSCEDFSNLQRLLRVTAYVLKFTRLAKRRPNQDSQPLDRPGMNLSTEDINAALIYWLRISQFKDVMDFGDVVADWRTQKFLLMQNTQCFLIRTQVTLIMRDCHSRVKHGCMKSTLTELHSRYWIVKGEIVELHKYMTCRRFQSKPYRPPAAPPLPSFGVQEKSTFLLYWC